MYVCMYVCMYACIYTCIHIYIYIYYMCTLYIYIHTYVYIYIYIYTYVYVYIYIYIYIYIYTHVYGGFGASKPPRRSTRRVDPKPGGQSLNSPEETPNPRRDSEKTGPDVKPCQNLTATGCSDAIFISSRAHAAYPTQRVKSGLTRLVIRHVPSIYKLGMLLIIDI